MQSQFRTYQLAVLGTVAFTEGQGRDPYAYAFVNKRFGGLGASLEGGIRSGALGALAAASYQGSLDESIRGLSYFARAEARTYASGFGQGFTGDIQPDYISYDQLDKSYTNAINLFVTDDDAWVFAGHLDLRWDFHPKWFVESLNELGQFAFRRAPQQTYFFYRQGIGFKPIPNRSDSLTVFASNKVITENWALPPHGSSISNLPLFREYFYLGTEANFRF